MSRFEMCFREVYLTTLCRIRRARRYYRYCSQSCGESVNKCKGKSPNQSVGNENGKVRRLVIKFTLEEKYIRPEN